jgi:hypothetical protein
MSVPLGRSPPVLRAGVRWGKALELGRTGPVGPGLWPGGLVSGKAWVVSRQAVWGRCCEVQGEEEL